MTSTYFNAFILCLLMIDVLKIDYARANYREPSVKFRQLLSSVDKDHSVWVNGDAINFQNWMSKVVEMNEIDDKNTVAMYTFVKCEIAHLINAVLEKLSLNEVKRKDKVHKLESLIREIQRAIFILFKIRNYHPSLHSTEPYFIKTLLMMSLYLDGLAFANDNIKKWNNDIIVRPSAETLDYMDNVFLQINNLFERFTVQHCYPIKDNKNGQLNSIQRLNSLCTFLMSIEFSPTSPPGSLMNMASVKLEKCMQYQVQRGTNANIVIFCDVYLQKAIECSKNRSRKTLQTLFNDIKYSYDIDHIYSYMLTVYKVILKYLFMMTSRIWDNNQSLDVKWCQQQISTMKSMNFPVEMIENFELALSVEKHKSDFNNNLFSAKDCFIENAIKVSDVRINEGALQQLTLWSFMNTILGYDFTHFWWAFNLLYKESEKKSKIVYDTSLSFSPGDYSKIKCDALATVYHTSLVIRKNNTKCNAGDDKDSITECWTKVHVLSKEFSDNLLEKLNGWINNAICLSNYDDFEKIILAAIINLRKNSGKELDFDDDKKNAQDYEMNDLKKGISNSGVGREIVSRNYRKNKMINIKYTNIKKLVIREQEKLNRTLDVFRNELENYNIKNCKVINNQKNSTEGSGMCTFLQAIGGLLFTSGGDQNTKEVKKPIPANFFDMDKLTGKDSITMKDEFSPKKTYFHWHGERKSIYDIRVDISTNMLDIHDLIEYQRLFSNWLTHLFYRMWCIFFDRMFKQIKGNNLKLINNYDEALNVFQMFYDKLFPKLNQSFFVSKEFVSLIFKRRDDNVNSNKVDLAEKEIIGPINRLLGVEEAQTMTLQDIMNSKALQLYTLTDKEAFKAIYLFMLNYETTIKNQFIYII